MDALAGRDIGLDGVEEADELLVAVALLMPVALAIMAATQWVASAGGSLSVRATTRSATSGPSTRSLSRPQVSDDNPFSEAQFKTLKYHPSFPGRFEDITAAIAFCRSFCPWYNTEHRHAGIAMLTPDDVHHHRVPDVLAQRGRTLQAAWALHPERFVHGTPKPAPLPEAVWINPPATSTTGETSQ